MLRAALRLMVTACRHDPAAGGAPHPRVRPARVPPRRTGIVAGRVPVGAPFVNVGGNAAHPIGVRRPERDRPGAIQRTLARLRNPCRDRTAARVGFALPSGARGAFPLRLGRQSRGVVELRRSPEAVHDGVVPAHAHHGQIRCGEARLVPLAGRLRAPSLQEGARTSRASRGRPPVRSIDPDRVRAPSSRCLRRLPMSEPACRYADENRSTALPARRHIHSDPTYARISTSLLLRSPVPIVRWGCAPNPPGPALAGTP